MFEPPPMRRFTRAMGNRMAYQPTGVPVALANRRRNPERDCRWLTWGPRVIGVGSHASPSRPRAVGAARRGPLSCRPNALSQGAASNRRCHRAPPRCSRARAALGARPGDAACRVALAVYPRFASAYSRVGRWESTVVTTRISLADRLATPRSLDSRDWSSPIFPETVVPGTRTEHHPRSHCPPIPKLRIVWSHI